MESEHDIEDGMRLSGDNDSGFSASGLAALCILGVACGANKIYQEGRKFVGSCIGREYERIEDGDRSFFRYGRVNNLRK